MFLGCSGGDGKTGKDTKKSAADAGVIFTGGQGSGNGNGSGDGGDLGGGSSGGSVIGLRDASCVTSSARAETIPLDIYVMFDQSGSMVQPTGAGSRLDAVRAALDDFMRQPEMEGVGIGIGYFGYFPIGITSCDPADYSDPDVPVGPLPDNLDAMRMSLNAVQPTGETPTGAAVRGACEYASKWKKDNPSHAVVVLLLTDGKPEAPVSKDNPDIACNPTLDDAVQATDQCLSDSKLRTYVLGVGPNLDNLNEIASAGGTEQAYLVEGGDVQAQVIDALAKIRGEALISCEFGIPDPPEGERINPKEVNVVFEDAGGDTTDLFYVGDAGGCDPKQGGGWYYDNPADPGSIILCDSTCNTVKAESFGGEVRFVLGCGTVTIR